MDQIGRLREQVISQLAPEIATSCLLGFSVVACFLLCLILLGIRHKFLHSIHSGIRAACLAKQHLALLIHGKDAAGGSLGGLLEANGTDEGGTGVAEQRIGQVLFRLEGSIGFGRISRETVDGQSRGGEMRVVVAEQADLLGTYITKW
jgi:hypothetical protein